MVRRLAAALVLAAAVIGGVSPPARAGDPPTATVVVNGKEQEILVVPLEGDGATPRADDLLRLGLTMMRGPATKLRLRMDQGRWYETGDDGKETLVGLSMSDGGTSAAWLLPPEDALKIPEAQFAALRGIAFDGWKDEFAPMLRRIDPSRCAVSISVGLARKVPALPDGLRALSIDGFLEDPIDLRPLANQTALRRLVVDRANVPDWSPLAGMKDLTQLEAGIRPSVAGTVPLLPSLRTFSAGYDDDVTDISFVARFPALQVLDLRGTGVTDLSPIAGLREIREVDATMTQVAKLPAGKVPSLRKLGLLRHRVPDAELRAFLDANPQCATEHSWRAVLDAAIVGADGVRLRTGGQCHRNPLEEETLFESRDPAELRAVLAAIAIDEPASEGHCRCCGGPTLELLRGGEIAASLTMHHGQALRYYGWPGDGRLTDDSADALCAWMTKRGARTESPRAVAAREAAEAKARDAAMDALLGAARGAAYRACNDVDGVEKLVREAAPETDARIRLLMRLARLRGGPRAESGWEVADFVSAVLRAEDPARLAAVLEEALSDPADPSDLAIAAAEAVWALDVPHSPLSDATRAGLRLPAARVIAARGGQRGRLRAVDVLGKAGTPEAKAFAVSLLPPVDKNGLPVTQPKPDDLELAMEIASFCEEKDLARICALAAAAKNAAGWTQRIEWRLERRREDEARKAKQADGAKQAGDEGGE